MIRIQILRFIAVGLIATAIQYAILFALVETGFTVVVASSIGFAISAVVNYALNRRFTFASQQAHAQTAPRFIVVVLVGLVCNAGFLAVFHSVAGIHYLVSQILATSGTLCVNFILNRMWTFAPGDNSKIRP